MFQTIATRDHVDEMQCEEYTEPNPCIAMRVLMKKHRKSDFLANYGQIGSLQFLCGSDKSSPVPIGDNNFYPLWRNGRSIYTLNSFIGTLTSNKTIYFRLILIKEDILKINTRISESDDEFGDEFDQSDDDIDDESNEEN